VGRGPSHWYAEIYGVEPCGRLWPTVPVRTAGPADRLESTYSVEKHKIDGDLIFLPRALSTLDPHPACPSADARAPTDVSSVSQYPLVSRCLGRL